MHLFIFFIIFFFKDELFIYNCNNNCFIIFDDIYLKLGFGTTGFGNSGFGNNQNNTMGGFGQSSFGNNNTSAFGTTGTTFGGSKPFGQTNSVFGNNSNQTSAFGGFGTSNSTYNFFFSIY